MKKGGVTENNLRAVFDVLENDPSLTMEEIGEVCGFSKQKVWRIINQLRERNIILGDVSNLNPLAMGKRMFIIRMERSNLAIDSKLIDLWNDRCIMIEIMAKESGLSVRAYDSYYMFSTYEWSTVVSTDTLQDLMRYLDIIRDVLGEYYDHMTYEEILWISHRNGIRNEDLAAFRKVNTAKGKMIVHGGNFRSDGSV